MFLKNPIYIQPRWSDESVCCCTHHHHGRGVEACTAFLQCFNCNSSTVSLPDLHTLPAAHTLLLR